MQQTHLKTLINEFFIHAIYIVINDAFSNFFIKRDERLNKHQSS